MQHLCQHPLPGFLLCGLQRNAYLKVVRYLISISSFMSISCPSLS